MQPPDAGPAGAAAWVRVPVTAGGEGPRALLLLADAGNAGRQAAGRPPLAYYLPDRPRLARDAGGAVALALTLQLARPLGGGLALADVVEGASLALDLTLEVPEAVLAEVAQER